MKKKIVFFYHCDRVGIETSFFCVRKLRSYQDRIVFRLKIFVILNWIVRDIYKTISSECMPSSGEILSKRPENQ